MKEEQIARDYKTISADYAWDGSIFNDEPDKVALLKYIINERLNQVDRTVIILYADCQSYRKLGKRFGLSHSAMRTEVLRIKKQILKIYEELKQQQV